MKKNILFALALVAGIFAKAQTATTDNIKSVNEVVTADAVEWGWLNPLRGDKSPAAGKLWGDRTKNEPAGFLVKFNKGFSSPPHIHNITYRGVVIKGLLHNDDEQAEKQWLPAGSYWQQPAGEAHITAADGEENMAFLDIQEGPYLVQPTDEAFDNGERPINVDKTNLVWLNAKDIEWVSEKSNVETAFLWGSHEKNQLRATLLKLPAGFNGKIKNLSPNFRAVVISGGISHQFSKKEDKKELNAPSYFGVEEDSKSIITTDQETVIYIRSNGDFKVK
jgi:quercetin dioxygenase-like cupin family protein